MALKANECPLPGIAFRSEFQKYDRCNNAIVALFCATPSVRQVGHERTKGASATNKFTANLLVTSPPDRLSGHVRSTPFSSHRLNGGLNILHLRKGPARGPFFSAERFYQGLRKRNDSATCRDGSAVAR
jgi:hypothetical protein